MGMGDLNGSHEKLLSIHEDVREVKATLQHSIADLAQAVDRLTDKFDILITRNESQVPVKLAIWMFVLATGAIAGVKTLDAVVQHFLGPIP